MWFAIVIAAQLLGPVPVGGEQDFATCTVKGESPVQPRLDACSRVADAAALDEKRIATAYAMLALFTSDGAGAIGYYDKAIALVTDEPEYYASRGLQYELLGEYDRAHADFEKGLALKPDHYNIFVFRALTYKQQKEEARALADLDRALAINPKHHVPYMIKGEILLAQGDTANALVAINNGLSANPDQPDLLFNKSEVYRKVGNDQGELAALTRLNEVRPNVQRNLLYRAVLYRRLGKTDLAIADFDALIALKPGEAFYREQRAALEANKGPAPLVPKKQTQVKKTPQKSEPDRECRVYVAAAALTISVPCAK